LSETKENKTIIVESEDLHIRQLIRKYYNCGWVFGKNVITVICDGEKFYIDLSKLNKNEIKEIKQLRFNGIAR
tara:strand:- start:144 stop:362 length:219 start_codon:yes stop_codon:yes gene_type:complete